MKAHQYDDAKWISRRITANSIAGILGVLAIAIGVMSVSHQLGQPLVDRVSASLTATLFHGGR